MAETLRLQEIAARARVRSTATEAERRFKEESKRYEKERALADRRAEMIVGATSSEYDRQFLPAEYAAVGPTASEYAAGMHEQSEELGQLELGQLY